MNPSDVPSPLYDLIVIGGGPAGEKAAARAAYHGKKVALVEMAPEPGGAGVHTGTLPSKTLKETALFLSGRLERGLYSISRNADRPADIKDFYYRKDKVVASETAAISANLAAHAITLVKGRASLVSPHEVGVDGMGATTLKGRFILVATGSEPWHPAHIPVDGRRIHDSDTILNLTRFPKSLVVIGGGVIGCEYATLFATLGTQVTLVEGRDEILPFLDKELTGELQRQMTESGIRLLLSSDVEKVEAQADDETPIPVTLKGGEVMASDMILYAAGRSGRSRGLGLEALGIEVNKRGLVTVNGQYQTALPHIYAVGDVIGFPALASTSMDQGRLAVSHMFQLPGPDSLARLFPYGIYTIPEVSMVGLSEEDAANKNIPVVCGRAHHRNMARGRIMGDSDGLMKLVFHKESRALLGVHLIGPISSEIIHYGLSAVERGSTMEDLTHTVFNYPTLHDLYKYAAYDALGHLGGRRLRDL